MSRACETGSRNPCGAHLSLPKNLALHVVLMLNVKSAMLGKAGSVDELRAVSVAVRTDGALRVSPRVNVT